MAVDIKLDIQKVVAELVAMEQGKIFWEIAQLRTLANEQREIIENQARQLQQLQQLQVQNQQKEESELNGRATVPE